MQKSALAGNRTRVARVAGEHSATEPPMLRLLIFAAVLLFSRIDVKLLIVAQWSRGMILA